MSSVDPCLHFTGGPNACSYLLSIPLFHLPCLLTFILSTAVLFQKFNGGCPDSCVFKGFSHVSKIHSIEKKYSHNMVC